MNKRKPTNFTRYFLAILQGSTFKKMRFVWIFFLASILFVGSVWWVSQSKTFRLDTDYDSNFPIVSYVVDTIRNEHRFPLWHPYVTTGISVLGDPLSGVTYLPYLLPMLIFGTQNGWWVVIGLHAFLAGVFMWILLQYLLISRSGFGRVVRTRSMQSKLSFDFALWGAVLYMGSGAFAARVAAGHIEKVLSYPWYPLFLLALVNKERSLRMAVLTGAVMGIVFLTGDIYGLFFMGMFVGVVRVIGGMRGIRGFGWMMMAFVVVSGIKLVPFLMEVVPVFARYSSFDAAKGSLHVFWTWIPLIMPFGVTFYDRPQLQHLFGFWYNWYEYYAFIGIPLIFLVGLPAIIKRREVRILILLLVVGLMYIARGYPYSVFYWMDRSIPALNWFRTPQRMYEAVTAIAVVLVVLSASRTRIRPWGLWGMLAITLLVNGNQMTKALEAPRSAQAQIVRQLRILDPGQFSVATFVCCTQSFLVHEKIQVINYYYGWRPKGAPQFVNRSGEGFDFIPLERTVPAYIIAPKDMHFGAYGYEVWFGDEKNIVWRKSMLTIYSRPGLPKG